MIRLIMRTMEDAAYIIRLMSELNVMPLAMQITNVAGKSSEKNIYYKIIGIFISVK